MQRTIKTVSVMFSSLLAGCTQNISSQPYQEYLRQAPGGAFNSPADSGRLQPFLTMFSTLDKQTINAQIEQVYAPELYFNDTFHTFHKRSEIRNYFISLADKAKTRVQALDYAEQGNDTWLRWKMTTESTLLWKNLRIETVGMTHLRFNDNGQIVLHQDYWDSAEGFFVHVPVLGGMIQSIRSSLGNTSGD